MSDPFEAPLASTGEPAHPSASLGRRAVARGLDTVLLLVVVVPAFVPEVALARDPLLQHLQAAASVAFPLLLMVQWGMLVVRGQTLAKWGLGLRVIRRSGAAVELFRGVVMRELLPVVWVPAALAGLACALGTPGAWLAVGLYVFSLLPVFGPRWTFLHDVVSDTTVVDAGAPVRPDRAAR